VFRIGNNYPPGNVLGRSVHLAGHDGHDLQQRAGLDGDLLVIGWGSSKGAIEEAVTALRGKGHMVSSLHLTFLQPMAPGIKEIMQKFKKVITIEGNWSDDPNDSVIDENNRRYAAVASLLRSRYLIDVDCWTEVRGQPIKPNTIERVLLEKLKQK
jgi:2-oxoglutarate ferredoxin oxidoreductase subunit alpha